LGWRALPDIGAYSFYRFECALRSSAILGFFGPETLGKFIRLAWNENHYGEVWTYLYTLFALILLADWWSGVLRRRYAA
jgi:phosphonate transport system permease protein